MYNEFKCKVVRLRAMTEYVDVEVKLQQFLLLSASWGGGRPNSMLRPVYPSENITR